MSDRRDIGTVVSEAEDVVRFRFPVRWSTLVYPEGLRSQAGETQVVKTQKAAFDPNVQWAMVIPRLAPAAPRLLPAAGSMEAAQFAAPKYVGPKFEVSSDSASLAVKIVLSAAVALLLVPGWRNDNSAGARAVEAESTMSERGWIRRSPELVLYNPSLGQTDYRIEFTWRANPHGVAWVFRAKDTDNYYAVRIKPAGPEPSRMLSVERFTQYRGVERSRAVKSVALSKYEPGVHIKMDISGSTFRLYLDGNAVSQWTDSRLPAGAFGFLEGGNQRADVQSLRISHPPVQ